ncbi:MAG: hypothetical protein BM564_04600 [Bacteroidetes bacterium MedPE-SWsnd-G2]|nr:MAG: hypothetical protein BM564_04600 [Bacteroidetes bacterium MedPE-SWsnd-G2]
MNQKLKTSIAFARNLFVTGAISETSRAVEVDICKNIPKEGSPVIVEFGMGHGNITRQILESLPPKGKIYAFEVKSSFCEVVREAIKDERLIIVNDGAETISQHVEGPIHAVISSIPFSFFGKEKGEKIIQDSYDLLEKDHFFSQVLYTKHNFKKFQRVFEDCKMTSNKNMFTEYIYHCKKLKSTHMVNCE